MKYHLTVRKRAEDHLTEAVLWYESQQRGLGHRFIDSFERTTNIIILNPYIFQLKFQETRIALLGRFPYGIFFLIDGEKVIVTAVWHLKTDPKRWKI